jgi:hypothetical protein
VKIYFKGFSITKTLLIAFRTGYKRVSLFINSRVIFATGEVSIFNIFKFIHRDGRGFVVPINNNINIGKGPKYFTKSLVGQVRSYTTRSKATNLATVQEQSELPKGFITLAKHWKICYQKPNKIFSDLRGLLKQDSIWYAAYLKIKINKGAETPGPDYDIIDSLTKKRILEVKEAVLTNNFSWIGVKEILIPKVGKPNKFRPLGIPSINDRLVQEVIRTIIEPLFELNFSNLSHGFRPNRGCHTALK